MCVETWNYFRYFEPGRSNLMLYTSKFAATQRCRQYWRCAQWHYFAVAPGWRTWFQSRSGPYVLLQLGFVCSLTLSISSSCYGSCCFLMSRWSFEEITIFDEMKSWCYSNHTKCEIECRSMCLFFGFILHKRQLYVKIVHFLLTVFFIRASDTLQNGRYETSVKQNPWSSANIRSTEAFCIFNATLLK